MVSRQSNLYNYTPLPRSLSNRVSFIYRVFCGHICDHAHCTVNILIVLAPSLYFPILLQHGAAITGNNVITVSMEIIAPATLFIGIWHQIWTRSALINRSNTGFILEKLKPRLWDGLIS